MERVPAGHDLIALRLPTLAVILPGHLQRGFVRLRSAVDEEAHRQLAGHDLGQLPRQLDQRNRERIDVVGKELEAVHLLQHGRPDFRPVVAADRRQERGKRIQVTLAVHIVEITTLAPHEHFGPFGQFGVIGEARQDVAEGILRQRFLLFGRICRLGHGMIPISFKGILDGLGDRLGRHAVLGAEPLLRTDLAHVDIRQRDPLETDVAGAAIHEHLGHGAA